MGRRIIFVPRSTTTVNVEGANYGYASGVIGPFGAPFAADVNAATAQAASVAVAPPDTGKLWQRLQMFVRWVTPAATNTATLVIYWYDSSTWYTLGRWPIKYITSASTLDDKRTYSDFTELAFPSRATKFAIGVENYTDGTFYVDLEAVV